jgi:hypothetical protein
MATETGSAGRSQRPRPILLVLLGLVVAVFLIMRLGGSSGPDRPAAPSARTPQQAPSTDGRIDPSALDVQLEALTAARPVPADTERNPFRFQAKAPPPGAGPPPGPGGKPMASSGEDAGETGPPPPPPPPPITVKFIGTFDLPDGSVVAVFTDCTVGHKNTLVREGGTILGQYRLVKIGLTSVVVEHLDGRGRTTLPKSGQDCVK